MARSGYAGAREEQGRAAQELRKSCARAAEQAKSSTECTHVFGVYPWTLWSRTTSQSAKCVSFCVFPVLEGREDCWLRDVRVRME